MQHLLINAKTVLNRASYNALFWTSPTYSANNDILYEQRHNKIFTDYFCQFQLKIARWEYRQIYMQYLCVNIMQKKRKSFWYLPPTSHIIPYNSHSGCNSNIHNPNYDLYMFVRELNVPKTHHHLLLGYMMGNPGTESTNDFKFCS